MTGDERVKLAFDLIRTANTLLSSFPFSEAARDLRRQEDAAWFFNPTLMVQPGAVADLEQKIRLLNAAAAFVREVKSVRDEVAARSEEREAAAIATSDRMQK